MQQWYLYIIRTADGALYTGITTDVERRFGDHRRGGARGSKFLKSRGPLELVYKVPVGSRSVALSAEARMKKLSRVKKESIVAEEADRERLLAILAVSTSGGERPHEHSPPDPREE
jgi:putative endonuclease